LVNYGAILRQRFCVVDVAKNRQESSGLRAIFRQGATEIISVLEAKG